MEEQTNPELEGQEISEKELARLEQGQRIFIAQGNPYPERQFAESQKVTWKDVFNMFGLELVFVVLSTLGAAYLSATRVGLVAEIAQINLEKVYLIGSETSKQLLTAKPTFWASMLAYEFSLIGFGLYQGRRLLNELKFNGWAVGTAFVVTILAGFLSTMTLVQGNQVQNAEKMQGFISIVFALVSAAAASIIAYFGAENVGHILQQRDKLQKEYNNATRAQQKELDAQFNTEEQDWHQRFQTAWPRIAKQTWNIDRRRKVRFEEELVPAKRAVREEEEEGPSVRGQLKQYLLVAGILPTEVGKGLQYSPSDIARAMNMPEQAANIRKYMQGLREEYAANPEAWVQTQ